MLALAWTSLDHSLPKPAFPFIRFSFSSRQIIFEPAQDTAISRSTSYLSAIYSIAYTGGMSVEAWADAASWI